MGQSLSRGYSFVARPADKRDMATDLKTIMQLTVPVIVRVGERDLPLEDVLALGPGAIIDLNKSAGEELDLLINNKSVGSGTAVKIGENFGIRITRIGSARERVAAMGPDQDQQPPA